MFSTKSPRAEICMVNLSGNLVMSWVCLVFIHIFQTFTANPTLPTCNNTGCCLNLLTKEKSWAAIHSHGFPRLRLKMPWSICNLNSCFLESCKYCRADKADLESLTALNCNQTYKWSFFNHFLPEYQLGNDYLTPAIGQTFTMHFIFT